MGVFGNYSKGIAYTVAAFLFAACIFSGAAYAAELPKVEQFSPQGTAKGVRQVTARFSEQMVSFGDPRAEFPFDVDCPAKGTARWVDTKNWAYDFDKDLPSGISCKFTLKPTVKTLSGALLSDNASFQFSTGGPSIIDSEPSDGSVWLEENHAFVLYLDGQVDETTVPEHVYCAVDGIKERIGVTLIQGKDKDDVLKTISSKAQGKEAVVLQCARSLPSGKGVKIVWGKGVKSKTGVASDIEQALHFKTQDSFTASFRCLKERATSGCIPMTPMIVLFSAPVDKNVAGQVVIKDGDGKIRRPKSDDDANEVERYTNRVIFEGPFAQSTAFSVEIPADLKDETGRTLSNRGKFPMKVRTDAYPPLAKFAARFGIIEQKSGAMLPVTVRNIEQEIRLFLLNPKAKADTTKVADNGEVTAAIKKISSNSQEEIIKWLKKTASSVRERPLLNKAAGVKSFTLPKPGGTKEFEVIGIPLGGTGFYVTELESGILGRHLLPNQHPMYVQAAALVTNLSAHFVWGRESSAVWVTTLEKGEPVKDAEVTLRDCNGTSIWQGRTADDGIARINQALPSESSLPVCRETLNWAENSQVLDITSGMFVFARTHDDLTFTHTSWYKGIEPWRFNLAQSDGGVHEAAIAHTVFDRTLLRAGQTVHMKHFLRKHTINGFE
ncbi:MAG: MG2 domain-containing protein, partial [Candidatus Magnetominusculus sp. LBB02]|nr:MG2 domain-containing protein [Candidatus Magnetominusculus sp. LBB02]